MSEWSLLIRFYGVLISLKIFCCEKLQMDVNVLRVEGTSEGRKLVIGLAGESR